MAKRNIVGGVSSFGNFGNGNSMGLQEHLEENAPHILEGLRQKEGSRIVAKPLPIDAIFPDPVQPRRVVPSTIRGDWLPTADTMPAFFAHWQSVSGLDIATVMNGTGELPEVADPSQAALIALCHLAAGIHKDGLLNPITVTPSGDVYLIETGERRWFAYHLLRWLTSDSKWDNIPAQVVKERSVWRQAHENNARENLNAIGKARQLAILLMDAIGWQQFQSRDAFTDDQGFYAQVADGEQHRIPRGRGGDIVQAMGMTSDVQIRQYRALLRLPYTAWLMADDKSVPEQRLRVMMSQAQADESELLRLLDEYSGDTVTTVTVSQPSSKPTPEAVPAWKKPLQKFEKLVTPRRWAKLKPEDRQAMYHELRAMVAKLEELGLE